VAVLSGVGGWAGIGLAAGLTDPTAGLGARRWLCSAEQLHRARWRTHGCSRCRSELTTSVRRNGFSMRRFACPDIEDKLLRKIWFVVAAVILVASRGFAFAEDAPIRLRSNPRMANTIDKRRVHADLQGRRRRHRRLYT